MDTNNGIFFESTESYEASQVLQQIAREYRMAHPRARLIIYVLGAVMVLGCGAFAYLISQVPINYDVPPVEVTR